MKAGREMDAKIARDVMGLCVFQEPPYDVNPVLVNENEMITGVVPSYSADISAAWLVVEHFRSQWDEGDLTGRFWCFKDCGISCGGWKVEIETCPDHDGCAAIYEASAATLAHAICLAALKAVS